MRASWILAGLLAVGLVATALLNLRLREKAAGDTSELVKIRASESALRAQVEQLKRALEADRPDGTDEQETREPVPAGPRTAAPAEDVTTRRELLRLLDEKSARLAANESVIAELERKVAAAEERSAQASIELEQLRSSEAGMRERLAATTRLSDSQRQESETRASRVAQLEQSSQEWRRRTEDSTRKLARAVTLMTEIQEIERQRETYLTAMLRRYREATDLFRTLSLRPDALADANSAGSTNLSRIQSVIAQGDEDLRQLRALNGRASRLQRDLDALR